MLACLAFCAKDKALAVRLAEWIRDLGGVSKHTFLVGFNKDTTPEGVLEPLRQVALVANAIRLDIDEQRYPQAANETWKFFVWGMHAHPEKQPWLWLEPDCAPLAPDWLDRIEAAYKACGKPFMADLVRTPSSVHHSGVGVYPPNVMEFTAQLFKADGQPWDVVLKDDFGPNTYDTPLIHDKFYQEWGKHESGPPVFSTAAALHSIEPSAVLFHRCKDEGNGSLIDRLRERLAVPASAPVQAGDKGLSSPSLMPEPQLAGGSELKGQVQSLRALVMEFVYRLEDADKRIAVLEKASSRITTAPASYVPFAERHVPSDGELESLQEKQFLKEHPEYEIKVIPSEARWKSDIVEKSAFDPLTYVGTPSIQNADGSWSADGPPMHAATPEEASAMIHPSAANLAKARAAKAAKAQAEHTRKHPKRKGRNVSDEQRAASSARLKAYHAARREAKAKQLATA